jgi:calcineurin-like phosphoesterase family protein
MHKSIKLGPDTIITGCTHLDHKKDFIWKARGFASPEDHANFVCREVADYYTANPHAHMIHLGDGFLNSTPERAKAYFARCGIQTYYIWGNHESPTTLLYNAEVDRIGFKYGEVYPLTLYPVTFLGYQASFSIEGQLIVANHFPLSVWDESHHGAWMIHSHNHHSYPESHADHLDCKRLDCGVDSCLKYFGKPYITFAQLRTIMDRKNTHKVDHHGPETT